jgi:glycerophosphoryl diester phosphodiesterase
VSAWWERRRQCRFVRIGHRGAAALAPQNTLAGFQCAVDLGVHAVELDVRRTADDQLVVMHDAHLEASTDGVGLVAAHTLEQIRACDAGAGETVPTLGEALDFLHGRAMVVVDLKERGYEEQVISCARERNMLDEVLLCGLDAASLRTVALLAPAVLTAFSYPEDTGSASTKPYLATAVKVALAVMRLTLPLRISGMMRRAGAQGTMLYHEVVNKDVVKAVHAAGGWIGAWTVDDSDDIERLAEIGVDSITSNRPDLLAAAR